MIDVYMNAITSRLKDESLLVRRQCLTLLTKLLQVCKKTSPYHCDYYFYTTVYVVASGGLYQVERVTLLPVCSLFG